MSEFNKWVVDNFYAPYDAPTPEQAFEAGAQSKQAEIDELRKQINESLLIVERMAKATNSTAMWAFDLDKTLKGTINEQ